MSLRPPATYWKRYTSTADFPGGVALTNIASLGANLSLQGVLFESAAAGGTFACTPSAAPAGVTPSEVDITIPAAGWIDMVPQTIGTSTTAFPFVLFYGPLGPGAR